ncbi:MAG: hypothetical protein H6632_00855 [Anaerolineales bacterium]|nr:hypothetical protein [Anaerolineales bacterium]
MSLLLINEDELRQTITIAEAIRAVKHAFLASAEGLMNMPGSFSLHLPDVRGKVNVEGTYFSQSPYYVVKIDSRFQKNPNINLPAENGVLLVFDALTGFPAAIMVDNGYVTNIKVGAAGALAADYLANRDIRKAAVIGANKQAFIQLKSLTIVRQIESVWVWDASPLKADNYVRHMVEDHDLNIRIAPSPQAAVEQADLVIAAAESKQPVVKAAWLKPGVHITSTALDHQPVKRNLEPEIWRRADFIVVDSLKQCLQFGELYHAQRAGIIRSRDLQGDLSDLISGQIQGRTQVDQITLADITGLGSHDTALATLALEKALFLGLGQRLEVGLPSRGFGVGIGNLL